MSDAFVARYLFAPPVDEPGASLSPVLAGDTFAAGVRAWLAHVKLPVPTTPPARVPADLTLAAGRKRVRWLSACRPAANVGRAGDGGCEVVVAEVALRRPDPSDPAVLWTTRATAVAGDPQLAGVGGATAVVVRVSADADADAAHDADDVPAPDRLALPPVLLSVLGDRGVLADATGEPFRLDPRPLGTPAMPDFVEHVLCDARRTRPVLVLTPDKEGGHPVPPEAVAREFFGLADVYVVERPSDTFALTDALGDRMLSVFWGAMRVYGLGFNRAADPYAHPLLFPERAAERSVRDALRRRLAYGAVARWRADPEAARVDARLDALRLEAELRAQIRAEVLAEVAGDEPAGVRAPVRRVAEPAAVYAAERPPNERPPVASPADAAPDRQEARLDALRTENARLRAEVAELRRRAAAAGTPGAPDSLEAAVALAAERFGDALYFLPSAYRAARASPYRRPDEALRLLEGLARVARRCQQGAVPGGVYEACREAGLDYASGAAESTSARLRAQYVFRDGAHAYTCAEHLRKGVNPDPAESLRIYFTSRELRDERFVVGHVGAHLRTMSTN